MDENGCEGILEMRSQSEMEELENDRRKLHIRVRNVPRAVMRKGIYTLQILSLQQKK